MSNEWKAPPLSGGPVELFIGILSAGNHFAERMAVRKSWMQSRLIKSSKVVARFFVALVRAFFFFTPSLQVPSCIPFELSFSNNN